jgi:hypothetical protein
VIDRLQEKALPVLPIMIQEIQVVYLVEGQDAVQLPCLITDGLRQVQILFQKEVSRDEIQSFLGEGGILKQLLDPLVDVMLTEHYFGERKHLICSFEYEWVGIYHQGLRL